MGIIRTLTYVVFAFAGRLLLRCDLLWLRSWCRYSRQALLTRLLITSLLCLPNFDPFYKSTHSQSDYGYYIKECRDGRVVYVAQRIQRRSSESGVRITLQRLFSILLGGRIISPRVGFEFCRQGITLEPAWGPCNSSPGHFFFTILFFLFLYSFLSFFFLSYFYYTSFAIIYVSILKVRQFSPKFDLNFYSERIYFTTLFIQLVSFSLFVG